MEMHRNAGFNKKLKPDRRGVGRWGVTQVSKEQKAVDVGNKKRRQRKTSVRITTVCVAVYDFLTMTQAE